MSLKPYIQGDVDGLCGFYSLLNALRLIQKDLSMDDCCELADEWLMALEKKRGAMAKKIIHGLHMCDLNQVLILMSERFGLRKVRPFSRQANVPLDVYWNTMQQFFKEGNHRAVIMPYHFTNDCHWSVVKDITDKTIRLFDSCGARYLQKSKCTTHEINGERPIRIYPASTFYLMKSDG